MATNVESATAYVNYTEFSGDSLRMSFTYKDEAGTPVDMTSQTVKMDIKVLPDDAVPLLTLTEIDGIVLGNAESNIVATITDTQTLALGVSDLVYDMEFKDSSGHVNTLISGSITLEQGVTDPA